ncbi:hypothetical protein [Runella limosa]|uniref:hypothetical protein n=1 Tax=Runella limosa TaxID=370978 RepID=UPI00048DE34A|nr:hypothetical protein [Runella limosa]
MRTIQVTDLVYSYLTKSQTRILTLSEGPVHTWLKKTLTVEKATCYISASRKVVFYPNILPIVTEVDVHWTRRRELLNELETFLFNEIAEAQLRIEVHARMADAKELIKGYEAFCTEHGLTEDVLPFERVMRTYTNKRPEEWRRYKK